MRKILSLLAIFSGLAPGIIATKNTIGCGVEKNNMVKIYRLQEEGYNNNYRLWKPVISANSLIIVLDKTKVEKYTLEYDPADETTWIKFYFKDGTINNTNNEWWHGPPKEYAKYIKSLIGLDPTPHDEWMPVWGVRFIKGYPEGWWEKDYKSKESFALNPKLVNKVFLKKQKENIFIKIEYIDGTIEEHLQTKGDLKYFHDQFAFDLKIHNGKIIEE